jgi:hypothetical protein
MSEVHRFIAWTEIYALRDLASQQLAISSIDQANDRFNSRVESELITLESAKEDPVRFTSGDSNQASNRESQKSLQNNLGDNLSANLWLPLVLTARGILYGEIIAQIPNPNLEGIQEEDNTLSIIKSNKKAGNQKEGNQKACNQYVQPLHLSDGLRQPIYQLGRSLLGWIGATPGVYLVQFGIGRQNEIFFDRLIPLADSPNPFTTNDYASNDYASNDSPASASIGVQTPNLFECQSLCLSGQPIRDLLIDANLYFVLDSSGVVVPNF